MSDIQLQVNGLRYGGWKEVAAQRSMENASGAFSLTVSQKWPGQDVPKGINPGDACTVLIESQVVITGYVDDAKPGYDGTNVGLTIEGRDKTADLVDCSAVSKPGEWIDQPLEAIVSDICKPFGIAVLKSVPTGKAFTHFRINEGETAWSAIERACRMRAVLAMPDGRGALHLTREGGNRYDTVLEYGKNIVSAGGAFSQKDRFSDYIVKSQQPSFYGSDAEAASGLQALANDSGIRRYRPKVIIAEQVADGPSATDRAQWEAKVRRARGRQAVVTVRGWTSNGRLWEPNRRVHIRDEMLSLDQEMLIAAVAWSKGERGTTTDLTLMPVGGFDLLPEPEQGGASSWMD